MRILIKAGDILDEWADVLVCSANPHLNLSGGVNGAILLRGGAAVQQELRAFLAARGRPWVEPGTVVRTGPGPLAVGHVLHAVAVDAFYGTSADLVRRTIERALADAAGLGARTVALTALATGYGRMRMADFARALAAAVRDREWGIEELRVVVRHEGEAETLRAGIGPTG